MSTQLDERPDLEIIEQVEDENKPRIAHVYCQTCNKGPMLKPGDIAFCGHVRTDPPAEGKLWWVPDSRQLCIVCEDMAPYPCLRCGH